MKKQLSRKVILILVGFLFAVFYVMTRVRVVEVGYEVSRIREQIQTLKQEQGILETNLGKARASSRLDLWTKRLGMHPPSEEKTLYMDKSR